jgi:hypothetical protein
MRFVGFLLHHTIERFRRYIEALITKKKKKKNRYVLIILREYLQTMHHYSIKTKGFHVSFHKATVSKCELLF